MVDKECLISSANEALVKFNEFLEPDNKSCEAEPRDRWVKFKESVAKGEVAGFRIIKQTKELWASDEDVSSVAQLMSQAGKWQELWAGGDVAWNIR